MKRLPKLKDVVALTIGDNVGRYGVVDEKNRRLIHVGPRWKEGRDDMRHYVRCGALGLLETYHLGAGQNFTSTELTHDQKEGIRRSYKEMEHARKVAMRALTVAIFDGKIALS